MSQHTKTPIFIVVTILFSAILLNPRQQTALMSQLAPTQPTGAEGRWEPIFIDEFEEASLNPANWVTCYWWDWQNEGCTIASNEELQWYQDENVSINDGVLTLQAKEESSEDSDGKLYAFTSGVVTTGTRDSQDPDPHRFLFQYGFAEIRARVPEGQGLWSAFWLLPADHNSKPEIDVMEILGHDTFTHEMHFHFINELGEPMRFGEAVVSEVDLADDWHTYGIDWQPTSLTWYLDGVVVWHYESNSFIPDEPMYLILNLAVGGDWPGDPDNSTGFPANYEIDYVKVWRKHNETAVIPLVQDAFINLQEDMQNFGEATILSIDGDPQKITLLQFDASAFNITPALTANLRVHTAPELGDGSGNTAVIYHIPHFDWDEEKLTFANGDFELGTAIGSILAPEPDTTYEIPLDTTFMNQYQENNITLAIVNNNDDGLHIFSKENNVNIPRLIVQPLDYRQYLPMVTMR